MKRKIVVIAALFATTFFWLPSVGNTVSAKGIEERNVANAGSGSTLMQRRGRGRGRRSDDDGRRNVYRYRNYGQYRRTQVGNRRHRMVKRYYYSSGVRRSRWVRVRY